MKFININQFHGHQSTVHRSRHDQAFHPVTWQNFWHFSHSIISPESSLQIEHMIVSSYAQLASSNSRNFLGGGGGVQLISRGSSTIGDVVHYSPVLVIFMLIIFHGARNFPTFFGFSRQKITSIVSNISAVTQVLYWTAVE